VKAKTKKFEVVCFGSAVVDAFVKINFKEDSKKIMIPSGSKMLMKDLYFEVGGGGTNTSVAFSRLGLRTGYIGKIGDDKHGEQILDLLKKEKITFLGNKVKGETNGFSVILISKKLNRSILTYKGINNKIGNKDVKKFQTNLLYLSSLMEKSFKTQISLAKELKKKGTKIAFNPSEYLIKKVNLNALLKLCDILIVNKEEARLLTNKKNKLKEISKMGPSIVVITDERRKVYCYDSHTGKTYSIYPPKLKVVEKTGAGDAFAAGFVAGLIKKKPIEYCLELGVREASAVIRHVGAKNNLLKMKLK
jgi:ribokinase